MGREAGLVSIHFSGPQGLEQRLGPVALTGYTNPLWWCPLCATMQHHEVRPVSIFILQRSKVRCREAGEASGGGAGLARGPQT